MAIINLQLIAALAYKITSNINKIATDLVGLDCIWSRSLPYENGEDVIVQEYTLHSYECPKTLKVVTTNANYLVGDFTIDALGIHASAPFEINVDIAEWDKVYGTDSMPQQGDFVLVQMFNRPFEVKTSSIIHSVGEIPIYYRCQLTEWKHQASRKESEDFKIDFDNITVSLDRLFGEQISKEVADAVVEVETSYKTTTYVDPIKEFDIDSIVMKDIIGEDGNSFANSYYDFSNANKNITYNVNAIFDIDAKENHWIYTCWFKYNIENSITGMKFTNNIVKEKDYWYFGILTELKLNIGDKIVISRGNLVLLDCEVSTNFCEAAYSIKIPASICLSTNKKITNWWQSGFWKIKIYNEFNILTGYNNDNISFKVDITPANINIRTNNNIVQLPLLLENKINQENWHYFALDICLNNVRVIIIENKVFENGTHKSEIIADINKQFTTNNFEIDKVCIENKLKNISMSNIRLYENEYELGDSYKLDMYSLVTKNASKLILVDTPRPENKQTFISSIR